MNHELVHATLVELLARADSLDARFRREWEAEQKAARARAQIARDERQLEERHRLTRPA